MHRSYTHEAGLANSNPRLNMGFLLMPLDGSASPSGTRTSKYTKLGAGLGVTVSKAMSPTPFGSQTLESAHWVTKLYKGSRFGKWCLTRCSCSPQRTFDDICERICLGSGVASLQGLKPGKVLCNLPSTGRPPRQRLIRSRM